MYFGDGLGRELAVLYAMAMVGAAACVAGTMAIVIAIPFGIWWLCHHVTFH